SPDSRKIAFDHRKDPLNSSQTTADISIIDITTKKIAPLVTQAGSDSGPRWSHDGRWILFGTKMGDARYYTNSELARIPSDGGGIELLTESFDENLSPVKWTDKGIYCLANEKTFRYIYLLDPEKKEVRKIIDSPENIGSIRFADDNDTFVMTASDRTMLSEIYKASISNYNPVKITNMTAQVDGWKLGTREVVEWKSKDGAVIDGVLWKPENFVPTKKYPLLVIIHGGPSSVSRPSLISGGVYPFAQWLTKGALILQPNYRGSTGYGEKFRSLNVRNLGVGDAWDVESGVDFLVKEGYVDPEKVGSMGWSQGGYISAFLTTTSKKFKAISVGAGISDWVTYYVNTDIHPFTRHYLKGDPWRDPDVYAKTSPMTYIKDAQTPTLIQHGEFDQRVPIPNAYKLYQGLQDMDITVKLIVYKDFGHGISRPKERLAATWHNWQWFAKYIWGEEIEIPIK
ncbi:S9 family peptidase, partial [candidate division KSB1 bacterium]